LNLIGGIVALILGVALLKFKEWGRKSTIIFTILAIPIVSIYQYHYFKLMYSIPMRIEGAPGLEAISQKIAPVITIVQVIMLSVVVAALIFYLTRPKVKEMFR
jgi:hypothetical protein